MNLKVFKTKVYALIEELNPNSPWLTDDTDLRAKVNEVINQVMFEMIRYKKIPKYVEMEVSKGQLVDFNDLESACGYEVYQRGNVGGVEYESKADGTILKFLEDGVAEVDLYVYPERITDKTKDTAYEFEVSPDILEVMVYGVAADLLLADESAAYGKAYSNRYNELKQMLDTRYQTDTITIVGGFSV